MSPTVKTMCMQIDLIVSKAKMYISVPLNVQDENIQTKALKSEISKE